MIIDIKPIQRSATSFESIILEMREIPCLYEISTCDAAERSVQFDTKSLGEFCPNKTVSQFLLEWEDGINRRIQLFQESLDNNTHPYWTHRPMIPGRFGEYGPEEPQRLSESSRIYFENEIKKLQTQVGPLTFTQIIQTKIK